MFKNFQTFQKYQRKYHRFLAPILLLPLTLTVITGMLVTLVEEWHLPGLKRSLLMDIHTGEIFHLEAIYPLLDGLGLLALILTGLSMLGWFKPKRSPKPLE